MSESNSTSTTPEPRRRRFLPRTVLGITSMVLAFSIGAAGSGAILYTYYEYNTKSYQKRINTYIEKFDDRFRIASDTIDAEKQNAQATIQQELEPLRQFASEGGTTAALVRKVNGSVWFVETRDEAGAPSVGSAFVVASDENSSTMVTSYSTVRAATQAPGPDIFVMKGDERIKARLDNWVPNKDLAVITVPKGNIAPLPFVPQDQQPQVGERTFVASGLGSAGAAVTQGFISDVSAGVIQEDAAVGPSYQGGPLLNADGEVTGVASIQYAPYGFQSNNGVWFAIPIRETCKELLVCPPGNDAGGASAPRS